MSGGHLVQCPAQAEPGAQDHV